MKDYILQLKETHPVSLVLALLIFSFPVVAETVDSGATTIFSIWFLLSLIYGWRGWHALQTWEKFLLYGMLAFAIVIALSMTQSEHLDEGISKYSKYLRFAAFVPMYLMVRRWNPDLSRALICGVMLASVVMTAILIYQHYWQGIVRPGGAQNPIHYAETLMIVGLLAAVASLTRFNKTWQILVGIIVAAFALFGTYLTLSRGVLFVFPFFLLLLLIYFRRNMTRPVMLLLISSAVLIATLGLQPNTTLYKRMALGWNEAQAFRDNPVALSGNSWGLRMSMLLSGYAVFAASPILGTGLGDYTPDVKKLIEEGRTTSKAELLAASPHNSYLQILAISGVVGFAIFMLGVFGLPLYVISKFRSSSRRTYAEFYVLGGYTIILTYMIFALSSEWINYNTPISVYLLLLLVMLAGLAQSDQTHLVAQAHESGLPITSDVNSQQT